MTRLSRITGLFIICFLLLSGQGFHYGEDAKSTVDLEQLDAYFAAAREAWNVPGMAVAIVKGGKVVLVKGYGLKTFNKEDKTDEHTLFAIASNTKAFGSAAISILVDEGKMKWNDKVQKHLPYFQLYDPYVSAEITVRDLLCHRSGLGTFSGDLLWYETSYSSEEIIKRAKHLKPKFGFRAGYGYSNLMYITASEVTAAASGKPWKEFVKERIFKPLGMTDSNIGTSELAKYKNVATPHFITPDDKTVTVPYSSSDSTGAAAAINSSAADMAQWLKMLLADGKVGDKQILSPNHMEEMWTPFNSFKVGARSRKFFPSTHFRGYGLGWSLSDYRGHKVIGHGGALDGMISRVALVPEAGLGMVILTNSINGLPGALMYKIIDSFIGAPDKDWSGLYLERMEKRRKAREEKKGKKKSKKKALPKFQVNLEDYAGRYGGPMYGDAEVAVEKGKLVLNLLPSPIFISDLTPLHYDTFRLKLRNKFSFIPGGEGTVQFIRDKKGKVVEMKVDIPNNDFHFTELEFKKRKD